jgi:hypothetical protein
MTQLSMCTQKSFGDEADINKGKRVKNGRK